MSGEKYIILRGKGFNVPTIDNMGIRGHLRYFEQPEALEIEEAELTRPEISELRRDPGVRAIAPPIPMKLIKPVETNAVADELAGVSETWGIKAVRAHDSNFDGSGITVAVLDTGIDPGHPAFHGIDVVQKNFTDEEDNDQHGHGTHCAGTIFGQDYRGIRIGVARKIKRALIGKVLGKSGGSSDTIAKAIQWAVNEGAHVISMSLGINFPGFVDYLINVRGIDAKVATTIALEGYRANINLFTELARFVHAQSVFGQGTIIVAASGNESSRPAYEISVSPPAAGTDIIAVGALRENQNGHLVASFSNNQVNVSAPGVSVISSIPGEELASKSGTSMATPHVAGIAALWAQRQLERTGRVETQTLMARVIACGTMETLIPESEVDDVGTGIVQAPLD